MMYISGYMRLIVKNIQEKNMRYICKQELFFGFLFCLKPRNGKRQKTQFFALCSDGKDAVRDKYLYLHKKVSSLFVNS
jgi:hypothetical protein